MLYDVVEITNHESQNLFAETLLKLVGARRCGAGSWPRGSQAVTELARSLGVEGDGLTLHDGSGLSRENRSTPRQMTAFLAGMARQPVRDAFVASMPTGGEQGTSLEKRLEDPPYPSSFYAKTGTLTGVSTLSGYARGSSGRLYAFSVLTRGGVWGGRQVQDAVVRALVDHG
jgi:D-alanyl-D-alanine carboxypeptidase/D-alanyl-D-alanine-endopeptidase (penicillin-binding protein 4)